MTIPQPTRQIFVDLAVINYWQAAKTPRRTILVAQIFTLIIAWANPTWIAFNVAVLASLIYSALAIFRYALRHPPAQMNHRHRRGIPLVPIFLPIVAIWAGAKVIPYILPPALAVIFWVMLGICATAVLVALALEFRKNRKYLGRHHRQNLPKVVPGSFLGN